MVHNHGQNQQKKIMQVPCFKGFVITLQAILNTYKTLIHQ